jgi:hypothetical protein
MVASSSLRAPPRQAFEEHPGLVEKSWRAVPALEGEVADERRDSLVRIARVLRDAFLDHDPRLLLRTPHVRSWLQR